MAWVAERKDVLSGLFFMLVLWTYAIYAARPSLGRYLLVALCLALGLMAKPMLVTLPFVLLLLDYWPLGRLWNATVDRSRVLVLIGEKLPLLLLVAGSTWITLVAQRRSGSLIEWEELSLSVRLGNALVAYVAYIAKAVWPTQLAVFYPHPGEALSLGRALAALLLLATLSGLVLRFGVRRPYLPVGWFWYVGTLVPVIGLVQVGVQGLADRYTYLPVIGLFLVVAWGGSELLERWRHGRRYMVPAALAVLCALSLATWVQVSTWRDSVTLFEHALRVTPDSALIHTNLGDGLLARGRDDEALAHYVEALRVYPRNFNLNTMVAGILGRKGQVEAAQRHWAVGVWRISEMEVGSEVSSSGPERDHLRLATELARGGRMEAALIHFERALQLDPSSIEAKLGLGSALLALNRRPEAIRQTREVLELEPQHTLGRYKLAVALILDGRGDEAVEHLSFALRQRPKHPGARYLMRELQVALPNGS